MVQGEMLQLRQTIPDPDVLLALEPEELAAKLLFLIRNRSDLGGRYHAGNLENELWHDVPGQPSYPRGRQNEISLTLRSTPWLAGYRVNRSTPSLHNRYGWLSCGANSMSPSFRR